MLGVAPSKPKSDQRAIQLGVLGPWCLAQSIECLDEPEHLPLMFLEHEPGRLLDVDLLLQLPI